MEEKDKTYIMFYYNKKTDLNEWKKRSINLCCFCIHSCGTSSFTDMTFVYFGHNV